MATYDTDVVNLGLDRVIGGIWSRLLQPVDLTNSCQEVFPVGSGSGGGGGEESSPFVYSG